VDPAHHGHDRISPPRGTIGRMTDFPAARGRPYLIVATVTPMTDDGSRLDLDAIDPYVSFLESHGADGAFVAGTTGEGILLSLDERRRLAEAFRSVIGGTLVVHAGAQTTADTCALAAHAVDTGADAVAVIAPPYFALDADALTAHFVGAARACAPLPFFIYAFTARSGYPIPTEVIGRVADSADNLAGLKVSESPFDRVAPYLDLALPVLIGSEPLIPAGLARGAVGSVSGMAAAFPDVVRAALDDPSPANEERLRRLRAGLEASGQFIAAAKHLLGARGVPVGPGMRSPLRRLRVDEQERLGRDVAAFIRSPTAA
jgi:dihydrodipicolinate synthase/N-acetylneuraminate lyase